MNNIIPVVGRWYKAHSGSGPTVYTIRLTRLPYSVSDGIYLGKPYRVEDVWENWEHSEGGFTELLEEVSCPEEFFSIFEEYYEIY